MRRLRSRRKIVVEILGPRSWADLQLDRIDGAPKASSGAAMRSRGKRSKRFCIGTALAPLFFLPQKKDSAVRSRFDAAHELGHLVLHKWIESEELEDPKTLKSQSASGGQSFCRAPFRIPAEKLVSQTRFTTPRLDRFCRTENVGAKVAIQAMVYRCKDLGIFDEFQITNLYKQISFRKWRTREPLDNQIPLEVPQLLKRAAEAVIGSRETNRRRNVWTK